MRFVLSRTSTGYLYAIIYTSFIAPMRHNSYTSCKTNSLADVQTCIASQYRIVHLSCLPLFIVCWYSCDDRPSVLKPKTPCFTCHLLYQRGIEYLATKSVCTDIKGSTLFPPLFPSLIVITHTLGSERGTSCTCQCAAPPTSLDYYTHLL